MRILWLKTELLHPIDKGGKIRTYAMLRELKREHHVTYLTLDDGTSSAADKACALEYCDDLITVPFDQPAKGSIAFYADLLRNLWSTRPYAIDKYRSDAMRQAIGNALRASPYDVIVCDFLFPSLNVDSDPGVPTILFQHNVEASIWERHATVPQHPLRRAYMRQQWRRMVAWEGRECRRFDHVIAVSDADREAMRTAYGLSSVSSVPTGVDTDYFFARGAVERRPMEIVFTGSMDWMPNQDGIEWFCEAILPKVRQELPDVVLTIVGRNPTPRIRALGARVPGVEVTGSVPDVRPYLERAGVLIVPLRIGGGTRLKIFEGMAMGRATISTTIGAEGLPVRDGEDLLIANDADSFASAVIGLLRDPARADALGRRAAARVRREFSWQEVARQFSAACARVVDRAAARGNDGRGSHVTQAPLH